MIGQGRPTSLQNLAARAGTRWHLVLGSAFALLFALTSLAAEIAQPTSDGPRLRISWGGGEPARWTGRVALEGGTLSNLKLLGTSPDAAGSVWLENGGLRIASLSARNLESVEVQASSADAASMIVEISNGGNQVTAPIRVSVADLSKRPFQQRLDDRGNTLTVEQVPEPALRITTSRDPLIFAPGEQCAFELRPMLAEMHPGTTLDIRATLSPARGQQTLWSSEQRLSVPVSGPPTVTLNVPLPSEEGAYTVRVSASRPSGFRVGFFPGGTAPLAERSFDLVVVDGVARARASALASSSLEDWEPVLVIDPTNAHWWERLPTWTQLRRIPGLNRGALGSLRAGAVDLPLGHFVELPPRVGSSLPHWQAYSLPVEAIGSPHLLEIKYPADETQQLGISILEPNASGVLEGLGRDAGVYVEGFGRSEPTEQETQRLVFWPRTQAPLLLMSNAHPTAAAHFGQIRVLKPRSQSAAPQPVTAPNRRLVAAYLSRPLLPESFGATEGIGTDLRGPSAARATDDWQTFYESSTRLAEYLRHGGYNSAVVSVLADGSSLYPTSRLLATPLYDGGRNGSNPAQHDGLELLLRVFDREGLAFVPALQLATPIPELEALRRESDPQTSGLEWIGSDGRSWLVTSGTSNGLAPYYNLLDPRVQEAILSVVSEVTERYGAHRSLSGIAIQLSANGYAQLPPADWGFDDSTIARFLNDTGIVLPTTGPERFAARHQALTGPHAEAWRSWRATQVAEFYRRLASKVRETNGNRQVLLTMEEAFDHPKLAGRVRPTLLAENRIESTLVEIGISRDLIEKVPGVILCPTRYVGPMEPLADRAVDMELNHAAAHWRRADSHSVSAALLYHRARRRPLKDFEPAKFPFAAARDAELVAQPLAHGAKSRQPYVETLLDSDPNVLIEGGALLPIGQEDRLRPIRAILSQLPTNAEVRNSGKQPVMVRTYVEQNGVTLVAVNASPWRAQAEVTLELKQNATMLVLGVAGSEASLAAVPRSLPAGKHPWAVNLEPYGVEAVRITSSELQVVEVKTEPSEVAKAELAERLRDLENRDLSAPRPFGALHNASFELIGGAVAGWHLLAAPGTATVELDATNPQHGKTSLRLESTAERAAIESEAFPMPATGQMAMTVFVRGENLGPDHSLRFVFESDRGVQLGAAQLNTQPRTEWSAPYAIPLTDLPLKSGEKMRVRVELHGKGTVWLDNVVIYDLLFPLKWYGGADKEIRQLLVLNHAAKSTLEEGRITECAQLLDSYWPRFVEAYTPLQKPAVAAAPPVPKPEASPPAQEVEQPAPGVSERLKRMMPSIFK